jgi:hypothetical protein
MRISTVNNIGGISRYMIYYTTSNLYYGVTIPKKIEENFLFFK